ncbi:MAG: hypothetical protein JSV08_01595 [Acidobacteriota bacterium]|nr:MAG: hypothetical protein JSV08_01595 [Acidobacteriota bacterium]
MLKMVVTGWHNGIPDNKTGAGYGIRITPGDRDQYFERDWTGITLQFDDGDTVTIDLGLTREEFAQLVGAHKQAVYLWERGVVPRDALKAKILGLRKIGAREAREILEGMG